jgi:hypothetical protein
VARDPRAVEAVEQETDERLAARGQELDRRLAHGGEVGRVVGDLGPERLVDRNDGSSYSYWTEPTPNSAPTTRK